MFVASTTDAHQSGYVSLCYYLLQSIGLQKQTGIFFLESCVCTKNRDFKKNDCLQYLKHKFTYFPVVSSYTWWQIIYNAVYLYQRSDRYNICKVRVKELQTKLSENIEAIKLHILSCRTEITTMELCVLWYFFGLRRQLLLCLICHVISRNSRMQNL